MSFDLDSVLALVQVWALWFWSFLEVKILLLHIALNLIVAIAASIRTGEFLLGKVAQFLWKKVLPLAIVFGGFALVGDALDMRGIATTTWGLLETMLISDLSENLKKLGIPVPNWAFKEAAPEG